MAAANGRQGSGGLGWKIAGGVAFAVLCGWLFAAYLQPGMLMSFNEVMAFCAALFR